MFLIVFFSLLITHPAALSSLQASVVVGVDERPSPWEEPTPPTTRPVFGRCPSAATLLGVVELTIRCFYLHLLYNMLLDSPS